MLMLALAGAVLLWAALPPLGWSLLAWIAPIPWLLLVRDEKLAFRRPYVLLWAVGLLHWLAVLQGVRLAHWATYFGWAVLSAYLAVYLPLFMGLSRIAVHRLRVPLWIAAPVTWTGLEFARGHFATGFSLSLLGHTQVRWTPLIQIADLGGAYAATMLVMFVAACLTSCLPARLADWRDARQWSRRPLAPLALALAATLGYGYARMAQSPADASQPGLKAALVQGWVDTIFEYNPERDVQTFNTYLRLSRETLAANSDVDIIIWPEAVFTGIQPLVSREEIVTPPAGVLWPPGAVENIDALAAAFDEKSRRVTALLGNRAALVVGVASYHYGPSFIGQYNSAAHITPQGEVAERYDKMHRVMFGEYVPLGELFPWIYRWTPLGSGLTPGRRAEAFEVDGVRLAPSVCFESTVPHLIRSHVVELSRRGEKPDVLVNHTNDGWFRGSGVIDLHLACGVFRAVEHRTPMLIAANTGLSAWIDGDGRIRAVGPRFQEAVLLAEVRPDPRTSLYTRLGDWPAGLCLAFCGVAVIAGVRARFRERRRA